MFCAEKAGFISQERDMFWAMMLLNSMRGAHSTGIAGVDHSGDVDIMKSVGGPESFSSWKESDRFFERIVTRYVAVLGHGRYATRGTIKAPNAHPFEEGNITLIHNGTMTNFDRAEKDYKKINNTKRKFETDTELCAAIAANDGVGELIKSYDGGYAFIIYDKENMTFTVTRNNERPLFMFRRKYRDMYYLSSDKAVFAYLQERFNIQGEVLEFAAHHKYVFTLGEKDFTKEPMSITGGKYGAYTYQSSPPYVHRGSHRTHTSARWTESDWLQMEREAAEERQRRLDAMMGDAPSNWVRDPETGIYVNKNFPKITLPPKKPNETLVQSEYNGHNFKLGDKIRFVIERAEERPLPSNGMYGTFLSGTFITMPKIAVMGFWPHIFDTAVPEKKYAEGIIQTIVPLDSERTQYDMRIHVHKIEVLGDDKKEEQKSNVVPFLPKPQSEKTKYVELADGSTISDWRYDDARQSGCACCGASIGPDDHIGCTMTPAKDPKLGGPRLICPRCTVENKLPEWVIPHESQSTMH